MTTVFEFWNCFAFNKLRDRKKSFRNFFKFCAQSHFKPQALRNRLRFGPQRNSNVKVLFEAFFDFRPNGTIYGPNSKKSSEKDFNVRISCRTKAESIPEGLGLKMALGAKLKKKYENFFYDPLLTVRDRRHRPDTPSR